ncbi:GrpB family protein [Streptomyces venezuelae]|uniref:GrpB family protein n=1 Tax=Streptomyces venezuelae TaxID=54571 RepID=A0A5P2C790_STRVZ|nr:GrpB family protein [Streptomyces venezuelae]QES38443.1 GrpB family protein [Streptomyces venezuelae]
MSDSIVISDHTPHWADQFRQLHAQLAPHVEDISVSIEHVGSTAVPGCAAKPIIDVDIVVADASVMPTLIARLTDRGYRHEGDLGITGREAFRAPEHPVPHHLYGVVEGTKPHLDHVLFRDHLRRNPDEVRRYAELKRALARRFTGDAAGRAAYTDAKSGLVAELLAKAYATAPRP